MGGSAFAPGSSVISAGVSMVLNIFSTFAMVETTWLYMLLSEFIGVQNCETYAENANTSPAVITPPVIIL